MDLAPKILMYNTAFHKIMTDIEEVRGWKNVNDLMMQVTSKPNGVIADRTGMFKGTFKTETSPIPTIPSIFNKTFEDICNERAIELLSTNKKILVSWSGGIDSTCVLVSLIKNATNKNQIKVMFEERATRENYDFYVNHIKDKLNYETFVEYWPTKCLPEENELLVNGDNIGQIFGMSATSFMENRYDSWEHHVRNKLNDEEFNIFMEKIPAHFAQSPVPIRNIFDMYWWISFSIRWTNSQIRSLKISKNYTKEMFDRTISFFSTDDFQIWSMLNHDKKLKDDSTSYKFVMKDIIYDYDGNETYRDSMTSLPSGGARSSNDTDFNGNAFVEKLNNNLLPLMVDVDFNRFYLNDIKENKFKFKKVMNIYNDDLVLSPESIEWYKLKDGN